MNNGNKIKKFNSDWNFKGNVSKNFDKHILRSVPLYRETHKLYLYLSDFFIEENTNIYDIGCSTGTFLNLLHSRHHKNDKFNKINIYGLDEVKEMINFCKKKHKKKKINFLQKSANKINYKNCSIISAFYTIQFIQPSKRQDLINKIFKGLKWGGAFFMVEKVRAPDARFQDIMNQVYVDYKLAQGFSSSEIVNKSRSLKGVLEPFSSKANIDMLKRAGFKDVLSVFKYGFFEGFLAIK